jgi:hypothetical protein
MKLLVDCFNYTTMSPTGPIELYNITADPYEYTNLATQLPATVATLLNKLRTYAASPDQVPPTLFPENAPKVAAAGISPWFYQCPQCGRGNAVCDRPSTPGSTAPENCHLDPWCDDVTCAEEAGGR